MKKLKIYFETTMFNYYLDEARDGHSATMRLFEAAGSEEYEGYTSEYVIFELQKADEPKRTKMLELIAKYNIKILKIDAETDRIAKLYISQGIIPAKYELDAAHIACATVNELDFVLSFNFQHINKIKTKLMTQNVNLAEGYKALTICTPMEVLEDE